MALKLLGSAAIVCPRSRLSVGTPGDRPRIGMQHLPDGRRKATVCWHVGGGLVRGKTFVGPALKVSQAA
jgi:hypothetical protein